MGVRLHAFYMNQKPKGKKRSQDRSSSHTHVPPEKKTYKAQENVTPDTLHSLRDKRPAFGTRATTTSEGEIRTNLFRVQTRLLELRGRDARAVLCSLQLAICMESLDDIAKLRDRRHDYYYVLRHSLGSLPPPTQRSSKAQATKGVLFADPETQGLQVFFCKNTPMTFRNLKWFLRN